MDETYERHEHTETQTAAADSRHERPRLEPRIYVASLSDYNAGRLHGRWIDAAQDDEALWADVRAMLQASPEPVAEEWAVHDFEGFGPLRLGEYEDLAKVARVARGIADHGPAYAHWAAIVGLDNIDDLERFEDAYLGHHESAEAYAEELLDGMGAFQALERAVLQDLRPYVELDVAGLARDLEFSGDITTSEGDGGVYVFDGRG